MKATVLARCGEEHAEAERLAREAASVYADLAEVLVIVGRTEGAVEALEQALARYERKENLVMAGRARVCLAELQSSGTAAERPKPARSANHHVGHKSTH